MSKEGKAYNHVSFALFAHVVIVHKCIHDGMFLTAWKGFHLWLEMKYTSCFEGITTLLEEVNNLRDDLCETNLEILLTHEDLKQTVLLWDEYLYRPAKRSFCSL